jgi:hypothetical protein
MLFFHLAAIKERGMIPGLSARFVHSQFMTFSYWNTKARFIVAHIDRLRPSLHVSAECAVI